MLGAKLLFSPASMTVSRGDGHKHARARADTHTHTQSVVISKPNLILYKRIVVYVLVLVRTSEKTRRINVKNSII